VGADYVPACAAIGRNDQRTEPSRRNLQTVQPLAHGAIEAQQLGRRLGLHPQAGEQRAELEIRHAAVEHGGKERVRVSSERSARSADHEPLV